MVDVAVLSEVVVLWSGWDRSTHPDRSDARIQERFGEDQAVAILAELHALVDDFYASDAKLVSPDLAAMSVRATTQFKKSHPDISDDAVNALAWCYTFDYK